MRALVFRAPGESEIVERDNPSVAEGNLLVQVAACGICGTDLHIYEGTFPSATFPLVAGHEFSGIIEATGGGVPYLRRGDHVAIDPNQPCGACRPCRRGLGHLCPNLAALGVTTDGGFATHCLVPARLAYKLQPDLPLHVAALAEPVSCCLHGIERANLRMGDVVAVLGAGMIGLVMLQLSLLRGASAVVVSEPEPGKREMALALGATAAVDPNTEEVHAAIAEITGGSGADAVLECVGLPETAQQAICLAGEGGTVVIFGVSPESARLTISPYDLFRRGITVAGSFTNPHTFDAALALLHSGRLQVEPLISHRLPLEEFEEGLSLLSTHQAMKVIIEPQL